MSKPSSQIYTHNAENLLYGLAWSVRSCYTCTACVPSGTPLLHVNLPLAVYTRQQAPSSAHRVSPGAVVREESAITRTRPQTCRSVAVRELSLSCTSQESTFSRVWDKVTQASTLARCAKVLLSSTAPIFFLGGHAGSRRQAMPLCCGFVCGRRAEPHRCRAMCAAALLVWYAPLRA